MSKTSCVCVCVCVCERERERERESLSLSLSLCTCMCERACIICTRFWFSEDSRAYVSGFAGRGIRAMVLVGITKNDAHNPSLSQLCGRFPQKCPVCPHQSKRTFSQAGLYQHAIAISKNNGNPEMARTHSVLLRGFVTEAKQETRDIPQQKPILAKQEKRDLQQDAHGFCQDNEVKFVWPWMGIMTNIDYEQLKNKGQVGPTISLSNIDIKAPFSHLNPKGVQALWNQGIAVLDFGPDLIGSFDAHDFENGFLRAGRGRLEWLNMIRLGGERVKEWFGWIADERDYNSNNLLGDFLRKRGTLRNVPRFREAWTEQHNQLFDDMRSKLQERNLKLMKLGKENLNIQNLVYQAEDEKASAEAQSLLSEAKHKQEIEAMHEKSSKAMQAHNDQLLKANERLNFLETEVRALQKKCQEFQDNSLQKASEEKILHELTDLLEEKEGLEDTAQKLIYKEREANDKIQNAMKACVEILQIKDNNGFFGNKIVGTLNYEPWKIACARKFKYHRGGWERVCATLISQWEKDLVDASWYPYKISTTENGKLEEHIDEGDEKLAKLREELGSDVYMSVVDALNELIKYNGSGRFPVRVPWNFKLNRPAHLEEILRFLAAEDLKKKRRLF